MTIEFKPVSPHVGAEVLGLDLKKPISESDEIALRHAFDKFDLLLVKQLDVTPEEQARFARVFGHIEIRNKAQSLDGFTQHVSNSRPDGILGDGEITFHQDHFFYPAPLRALILYGLEIPPSGSVTKFRSGSAAYNFLPDALKKKIEGVEVLHLFNYAGDYTKKQDLSNAPPDAPRAWWPLVWTNPATAKKTLLLSPLNVVDYKGISQEAGDDLLAELTAAAEKLETSRSIVFEHAWAPGDLVLWNNMMLHHARMPFNNAEKRTLRRTPIVEKLLAAAA